MIEKVQIAATRWIPNMRDLTHEERSDKLQFPALQERRKREDMIMLYNCAEVREKQDFYEYILLRQSSS